MGIKLKTNQLRDLHYLQAFSRALHAGYMCAFALNSNWFIALFVTVVTDQSKINFVLNLLTTKEKSYKLYMINR